MQGFCRVQSTIMITGWGRAEADKKCFNQYNGLYYTGPWIGGEKEGEETPTDLTAEGREFHVHSVSWGMMKTDGFDGLLIYFILLTRAKLELTIICVLMRALYIRSQHCMSQCQQLYHFLGRMADVRVMMIKKTLPLFSFISCIESSDSLVKSKR